MKKIFLILVSGFLSFLLAGCNITNPNNQSTDASNTYTITWKVNGVAVEVDTNVAKGMIPIYNGQTPSKPESSEYKYIFSGWSPSVTTVQANQTYVAKFDAVSKVSHINVNSINWNQYFYFTINLANVNQNMYTNVIREQLSVYYYPKFNSNSSTSSTNITVSGYVDVKIGYTTDNYNNIYSKNYKVYFTHFLYKNNDYYNFSSVSLYHNLGTSSLSTDSWVINVEVYLTSMSGTISVAK